MEIYLHSELLPLYKTYNEVIKPLITDIEIHYEKFPLPIFNEIRAFNDHISRCYTEPLDENIIREQIPKAKGHIERIVLDCYKFLNVFYFDEIVDKFEKRMKYIELTSIDSGEFYPKYKNIRNEIATNIKEAKRLERSDKGQAISFYERAYNQYNVLDDLLVNNASKINWTIAKFTSRKVLSFLSWLGAAIVSGIISSSFIPWDKILKWIMSIF